MQEHGAAAAGYPWAGVVIDFNDEIVEMVLARQPVAGLVADQTNGLIVVAVSRVLAPGVFGPDRPDRQIGPRPRMAVGAPPQLPGPEDAPWGAAIAFTLVGPDAATPKGDRDRLPARGQPAPARIAGRALNPDRGKWPIARTCLVSA